MRSLDPVPCDPPSGGEGPDDLTTSVCQQRKSADCNLLDPRPLTAHTRRRRGRSGGCRPRQHAIQGTAPPHETSGAGRRAQTRVAPVGAPLRVVDRGCVLSLPRHRSRGWDRATHARDRRARQALPPRETRAARGRRAARGGRDAEGCPGSQSVHRIEGRPVVEAGRGRESGRLRDGPARAERRHRGARRRRSRRRHPEGDTGGARGGAGPGGQVRRRRVPTGSGGRHAGRGSAESEPQRGDGPRHSEA